jgi:acetylornithine aminotransferase
MKSNNSAQTDWSSALQNNYGTPVIQLDHGFGAEVFDVEGNKYIDMLAGIATNILGHAHPDVIQAITEQSARLGHVSNLYIHQPVLDLATSLKSMVGDSSARVFFCNSGAEATEAAIKLSRLTGRNRIVATEGAFHGRTMGALSLTGQPAKREPFNPLLKKIQHVPFGDIAAMRGAVSRKTAMIIVEPIQGENGVVVPPVGYLRELRSIADSVDALLVFDCVQTGMGRTGQWFGYEHEGIQPDVITLAKGIGGGLPLGAVIAMGPAAQLFQPGSHGSTFGGNPIATAAANAVIRVIKAHRLMPRAIRIGEYISQSISGIPGVKAVRGQGLLLGVVLESDIAKQVNERLQSQGILANAATANVIRIAPALTITEPQVDSFIAIFTSVMKEFDIYG